MFLSERIALVANRELANTGRGIWRAGRAEPEVLELPVAQAAIEDANAVLGDVNQDQPVGRAVVALRLQRHGLLGGREIGGPTKREPLAGRTVFLVNANVSARGRTTRNRQNERRIERGRDHISSRTILDVPTLALSAICRELLDIPPCRRDAAVNVEDLIRRAALERVGSICIARSDPLLVAAIVDRPRQNVGAV